MTTATRGVYLLHWWVFVLFMHQCPMNQLTGLLFHLVLEGGWKSGFNYSLSLNSWQLLSLLRRLTCSLKNENGFSILHNLSVLVKTSIWAFFLDLCFWAVIVNIYLQVSSALLLPVSIEEQNSFISGHLIRLQMKLLEMQCEVVSHPLGLHFT